MVYPGYMYFRHQHNYLEGAWPTLLYGYPRQNLTIWFQADEGTGYLRVSGRFAQGTRGSQY